MRVRLGRTGHTSRAAPSPYRTPGAYDLLDAPAGPCHRVLLRLGDEPTINRLRHSVGGVPEGLWGRLKHLPTGQAIVSAQGIEPALVVALEPGRCKLRMVD